MKKIKTAAKILLAPWRDVPKLKKPLDETNRKLAALSAELNTLKKETSGIKTELGPIKQDLVTIRRSIPTVSYIRTRDFLRGAVTDGTWLLTPAKTGTTYTLNILAYYRALLRGQEEEFDFTRLDRNAVFHSFTANADTVQKLIAGSARSGFKPIIHTHGYWDLDPRVFLFTTRDIYDYCNSRFNFHYIKRRGREETRFEDVCSNLVEKYCDLHKKAEHARSRAEIAFTLRYKTLIASPIDQMRPVVEAIHGSVDIQLLEKAVQAVSVENVMAFEKRKNIVIVAGSDFVGDSFIQSAKSGAGRRSFNDAQLKQIDDEVAKQGLDVSEFLET